jgi:hypothetical protein
MELPPIQNNPPLPSSSHKVSNSVSRHPSKAPSDTTAGAREGAQGLFDGRLLRILR